MENTYDKKEKSNKDNKATNKDFTSFGVLNLLEDGIALVDREWKYRFLNDASLTLKYKSKDEVIDHLMWDVHPELVGSPFEALLKNAMYQNEYTEVEEYFEPFNAWLRVRIFPSEEGLTLFYTDITEKKAAEANQNLSETIINSSLDAIVTMDFKSTITSWNKGAERVFGYSKEEVLGKKMATMMPFARQTIDAEVIQRIYKGAEIENYTSERYTKSGDLVYLSISLTATKDVRGNVNGISAIARNITNMKLAEKELQKSKRLYAFLSAINQCIVHTKVESELLANACKIAEDVGNYSIAWIGTIDEDGDYDMNNMFGNEKIIKKYQTYHGLDFGAFPLSLTPTGRVLETGECALSNDVLNDPAFAMWKDEMVNTGLRSLIALPIFTSGKLHGIFSLYSSETNYFEENEIKLLTEAVGDISFGIEMIENEKRRLDAEEKIVQSKVVLNQSQVMALVGSFEIDFSDNGIFWSDEMYRLFGYLPNEVKPSKDLFILHVHPEDRQRMKGVVDNFTKVFINSTHEFRIITGEGEIKNISAIIHFEYDKKGMPRKLYGTNQNVTNRIEFEEKLKYSEAFSRAVIDSLSSHVGVLDVNGNIVATNESWKQYDVNHKNAILPRLDIGANLFEKCLKNWESCDVYTRKAILEMKQVLSGVKDFFKMEYPCRIENTAQWFLLRIMKFDDNNEMIVVAHEDITNIKFAEKERDNMVLELENRVYTRTKELHEINTNFTDSINYAKRIQLGVLTSPNQLKGIFHNSFLLTKPCNILSGDFFWCLERDNLKYIVVADCTGHGVPAALMSIVGNTLLNKIIKEGVLISDPARILSKLDKKLLKSLPGDDDQKVMDGMDLAICVINSAEKTIDFAGALRPLFILETDGNVLEIPGNRSCIGRGIHERETKLFETKQISYSGGEKMYLTSDGYYSQFGGQKGKKMMKRAFKSILENLVHVPIEAQRDHLNNALLEWQGNQQQIDDILVVGIELE